MSRDHVCSSYRKQHELLWLGTLLIFLHAIGKNCRSFEIYTYPVQQNIPHRLEIFLNLKSVFVLYSRSLHLCLSVGLFRSRPQPVLPSFIAQNVTWHECFDVQHTVLWVSKYFPRLPPSDALAATGCASSYSQIPHCRKSASTCHA